MVDCKARRNARPVAQPAAEDRTLYLCSRLVYFKTHARTLTILGLFFLFLICLVPLEAKAEPSTDLLLKKKPKWDSYEDSQRTKPCNNFKDSGQSTVYMKGTGFTPNHQYKIAYFDGKGRLVKVDSGALARADGNGVLDDSFCHFPDYPRANEGKWFAVVLDLFGGRLSVNDAVYGGGETSDADLGSEILDSEILSDEALAGGLIVAVDSFHVHKEAIPEFSSVLGAVGTGAACGLAYVLLRRKRCLNGAA